MLMTSRLTLGGLNGESLLCICKLDVYESKQVIDIHNTE